MTYFSKLNKEQLRELQLKSRESLHLNNRQRNIIAYLWYTDGKPIKDIAQYYGVTVRQAYYLIANGKKIAKNK